MRTNLKLICLLITAAYSNTTFAQKIDTLKWTSSFSPAWADGATSGNATNISGSGINATVSMTPSGGAFGGTTGTTGTPTPTINGIFTVQGSTANNMVTMDFATNADFTDIVFTFSAAIGNVKFNIADIDKLNATSTTYFDKVTITGTNGSQVYNPVVSKYVPTSTYLSAAGNSAAANNTSGQGGNSASSVTDQLATVTVNFGTAVLKTITIHYANNTGADANPAPQAIGIGNVYFSTVNLPPIANNFTNTAMPQGYAATAIPSPSASDPDNGAVASYNITSIPTVAQGVLSVPCPPNLTSGTCTGGFTSLTAAVLAAYPSGIPLTGTQAAGMRFDPTANFAGNASFTFTATDSTGLVSNTATYTLPVTAQPPVSNNVMENSIANTASATAIQTLNSSDPDGTISSYQLVTLPTTAQGVLSVPCPPNFTSGTCTGGFTNLTAAVLAAYPSGIPLTATQAAGMKFAPTAAFVGNAVFTYNAVDNSGNTSNTANYTIPVSATATTSRPPLADNVTAQALNNTLSNTAIPALQGSDLDGSVVSYTVVTIPSAASGVLRLSCPSTPTGLSCSGGFADIIAGTVLTAAEAARLFFDPAATFTGTGSFTYTAKDNAGLTGNTATYNIPVVNTPPVSSNVAANVPFNATATAIPSLLGTDADGTIASYQLVTLPTTAQGVLSVPCPPNLTGGACSGGFESLTAAVASNYPSGIPLNSTQAAGMKFTPTTNYSGTAPFTYSSTDNNGNVSPVANYSISITPQPPVTTTITSTSLASSATSSAISPLTATDADGTIASYILYTIPTTTQGVLSISCPLTFSGATCTGGYQQLTAAILANYPSGIPLTSAQATSMKFAPLAASNAQLVSFTFGAVDNSGLISNTANYYLPITGTGNIPPIAKDVTSASVSNTGSAAAISPLSATDPDGTIASYTLSSVPTAAQGTLSVPCPPNITGATCTGGFTDLTPTVLAANASGITLSTAQAAAIRFAPAAGYMGPVNFTYTATDNGGAVSTNANYNIPVTSIPPVATPVTAPAVSHSGSAASIPAMAVTDADGTVASYQVESLPASTQGVLSVPCPPNLTGGTCTGGFTDLTAAVLANYPSGIPLTPTQMAGLRFAPAANYVGNVVFNYHGTDNSNLISNSTTYTIPVTGVNPVSNEVRTQKIINSSLPTAIPSLNSTDADGTITSYIVTSVPPTSQGTITVPCPPNITGGTCLLGVETLSAAVLTANPGGIPLTATQAAGLKFTPVNTYNGNVIFNYAAFDNNGNVSNTAAYIIQTGTSAALPLSLTDFSGARSGNDVFLKWDTKNETGVSRFDVEYSTDGIAFTYAGTVSANNNANGNYQFTMNDFVEPVGYFRLKMVDIDGNYTYSPVVTVRFTGKLQRSIVVTPNPASENIQLKISSDVTAMADIQVISGVGQVLYHVKQQVYKGNNVLPMQYLSGQLTKGTYLVRAVINAQVLSTKFVFQK